MDVWNLKTAKHATLFPHFICLSKLFFFFSIPIKSKLHFKNIHLKTWALLNNEAAEIKAGASLLCQAPPTEHCRKEAVITETEPAEQLGVLKMLSAKF